MARRVWVIARKDNVEDVDIASAALNGCPEIANGIPPALQNILSEKQLPFAYEEPQILSPKPRDPLAEIDEIKAKIADYDTLKTKVEAL